jgi:Tfp pilus assembly protein PilW
MPIMQSKQSGVTLIELLLACVVGALLMTGLFKMMNAGLAAQTYVTQTNDATQQARFALGRMESVIRTAASSPLSASQSTLIDLDTTRFCWNNAQQSLRETSTTDATCTAGSIIAEEVISFSASRLRGGYSPDIAKISLTLAGANNAPMQFISETRIGAFQ